MYLIFDMKLPLIFPLFTIVTFIALIGCHNSSSKYQLDYPLEQAQQSEKISGSLVVIDTLIIAIDSVTQSMDPYMQLMEIEKQPFLIMFNTNNFNIQGYHLYDSSKNWKMQMFSEGPNAILNPDRFYYHNKDSIFFISGGNIQKAYLVNSLGIVKKKYDLRLKDLSINNWITNDHLFEFRYLPESASVSFWSYPGWVNSYDGYEYYLGSKACIYNLNTGTYATFGGFPKKYFQDDNLYEVFNQIHAYSTPDYWILNYPGAAEVQVFNRKTLEIEKHIEIHSKFIDEISPLMKLGEQRRDAQTEVNYQVESPYYFRMQANLDGSRHYRIVKLYASLRYINGKKRNLYDIPFSVMVLDDQLQIITEHRFKGGQFNFYQTFAYQDKFYINMNNPLNSNANENALQFVVFAIQ